MKTPFPLWPKSLLSISFFLWLPFNIDLFTSWTSKMPSCMVSCKKKFIWINLSILQFQVTFSWSVDSVTLSMVRSSLLAHGLVVLALPCSSLEWHIVRLITRVLFIHSPFGRCFYVVVDVDDIVITGNYSEGILRLKSHLRSQFQTKDTGLLNYFLGFEVVGSSSSIAISQQKYALIS